MDHQGHYRCAGTSRSYYSLQTGCKHTVGATNCFLITRVPISRWDVPALTGSPCTHATFHPSEQREGGSQLGSIAYLCWKSSQETNPSASMEDGSPSPQLGWHAACLPCNRPPLFCATEHQLYSEQSCVQPKDHAF